MGDFATSTDVLGAMITPVVLLSASGMLVLSTVQRQMRVVDRARALAVRAGAIDSGAPSSTARVPLDDAERQLMAHQIVQLSTRMRLLLAATTALYTAIGLFVFTSITVGVVAWFQLAYGWVPILFGLAGTLTLLYACITLIREARLTTSTVLEELAFLRETVIDRRPPSG